MSTIKLKFVEAREALKRGEYLAMYLPNWKRGTYLYWYVPAAMDLNQTARLRKSSNDIPYLSEVLEMDYSKDADKEWIVS